MVEYIPKWLHRRYIVLLREFGKKKFSFEEAQEVLEDDSRIVNLLISGLRNKGWLISEKDPKNPRKKLHSLRDVQEVYKDFEKDVQAKN